MTQFEDLSNELLFEILEYLGGYDILVAFSHLNTHFEELLLCSYVRLKFKFQLMSKSEFRQRCIQIVEPNTQHIVSLFLSDCLIIC